MKLTGKLVDLGMLGNTGERGCRIEVDGEIVTVTGMSIEDIRAIASMWCKFVTLSISEAGGQS